MVDGGAPLTSLAQAEFERLALYWQNEARTASNTAMHYAALSCSMRGLYRDQIAAGNAK